jgi:hypothetical protein
MARVDVAANRLVWTVQQGKAGSIDVVCLERQTKMPWSFIGAPYVKVIDEDVPFHLQLVGDDNNVLRIAWAASAHDGWRFRTRRFEIAADGGTKAIFAGAYRLLKPGEAGFVTSSTVVALV